MSELFSGNKGEWTEPYVLLKLLVDQELHFGDEYLNKIKDIVMPIISVIRQEQEYHAVYSYDNDKRNIVISLGDVGNSYCVPIEKFRDNTIKLLNAINNARSGDRTFEVPSVDEFLKNIGCSVLKAKYTSKSDIHIVIHDIKTGICPKLGFSIKSELGAGSTLFNASQSTNFTFKIPNWDNRRTAEINSLMNTRGSDVKGRVQKILEYGYDLEFKGVDKAMFKNNLVMVDSHFPEIMAKILKVYFSGEATSVSELVAKICEENPIGYDKEFHHKFYTYKVKHFLNIIALGMTPTHIWQGIYDATGGYLVVKENGEIVCYHIYSRNEFDNYLFHNTKFDTPSASKHKFGEIYEQNGEFFLKLNFQIRFQ